MQAKKANQGSYSLLPISKQMFIHFLESSTSAHLMATWKDKCHSYKNFPFLLSLNFYCWVWFHMVWVTFGHLSWLSPLLASSELPVTRGAGGAEEASVKKSSTSCKHAQQQPKHWCVITTVLARNPKHSTMHIAKNKINLIPVISSNMYMCYWTSVEDGKDKQCYVLQSYLSLFTCPIWKEYS